jgi:N-acetyl sugar amidotransferase
MTQGQVLSAKPEPAKSAATKAKTVCTRCIYDDVNVRSISFDEKGVCNYCHMIDKIQEEYKTATPEGEAMWLETVEKIKRSGKGKKYDCVIGVSGGTDSSFLTYVAVAKYGLRPLAVHLDNTWNTALATENIRKVLGKLKVDLYTHVVDHKEMDDIYLSFFKASVPDLDVASDIGVPEIMYRVCAKYGIKYMLEGHSYRAEGVSPLGAMYADGGYMKSVQERFGSHKIKTFPNMTLMRFLKWITFYRIEKVRPLWYIKYSKEQAREVLQKEFGWEYYGGHHLENRLTAYMHSVLCPRKFGIDNRNNSLSASVRSGMMSREDALREYSQPPFMEPDLVEYFKKRLGLSDAEYDRIMNLPRKTYRDYGTYKKAFERLRPFFWVMLQMNLVTKSFYIKYTAKNELTI